MKKLLVSVILCLSTMCVLAQKDVTQFLGIPVDGTKTEMIQKLKTKGFKVDPYNKDMLTGKFNGQDVNVLIGTNGDKVWRIMVIDENPTDEINIKIRFNNLCRQFENNPKYTTLGVENTAIPDNENISHEMLVNKKRYEAVYYQLPKDMVSSYILEVSPYKQVWFFISESGYHKYQIAMFYENLHNQANGEDL